MTVALLTSEAARPHCAHCRRGYAARALRFGCLCPDCCGFFGIGDGLLDREPAAPAVTEERA